MFRKNRTRLFTLFFSTGFEGTRLRKYYNLTLVVTPVIARYVKEEAPGADTGFPEGGGGGGGGVGQDIPKHPPPLWTLSA